MWEMFTSFCFLSNPVPYNYRLSHGHFGTKGDDQNVHVMICLSHLLNILFQRFVFRNAKNFDFCIEKENGTINIM